MAERRSVAADVVGSKPTSRPKLLSVRRVNMSNKVWNGFAIGSGVVLGVALVGVKALLLVRWFRDRQAL